MLSSEQDKKWVPNLHPGTDLLGVFKGTIEDAAGSVAILPDGRSMVIGAANGTIRKVDLETGANIWIEENAHAPVVQSLDVTNDGQILATASDDGHVNLWAITNGQSLGSLKHPLGVMAIAFAPDSKRLAVACCNNAIYIWDVTTMAQIAICQGHEAWVEAVGWSPDGTQVVSGSNDSTLRFWDAANGTEKRLLGFEAKVLALAWCEHNGLLATGGSDGRITVFALKDLENPMVAFQGHREGINCVKWNKEGRILATGGDDQILKLWEGSTGKATYNYQMEELFIWDISWSPNNAYLAVSVGGDIIKLLDIRNIVE